MGFKNSLKKITFGQLILNASHSTDELKQIILMNLHEYQGKELLKSYGVAIQEGIVANTTEEALSAFKQLHEDTGTEFAVVQAQIHAGGRGKGGGVKLVKNEAELQEYAGNILGMMLKTPQTPGGMEGEGKLVSKILVAEDAYRPDFEACSEMYVSILMDRQRKCNVIIYSTEGGMDIEEVAEKTPHLIFTEEIDPATGLLPFQARKVAFNLGVSGKAFKVPLPYTAYPKKINRDINGVKIKEFMYGKPSRRRIGEAVYIDDLLDSEAMNVKNEWS